MEVKNGSASAQAHGHSEAIHAQHEPPATNSKSLLTDWENGMIGWNSVDDPENPLNWSKGKKRLMLVFMGASSTLAPLASSMVAPSIDLTMADFGERDQVIGSFSVTIYLLGFALGPLALGPLSEMYGRYPILVGGGWFLVIWLLGCALAPTMAGLIVMRLLGGIGGSAAMTVAPAVCADMFPIEHEISFQSAHYSLSPKGSFIGSDLGWRWNYWFLLICTTIVTAAMSLFMHETYAPILLQRKATKLRTKTGKSGLRAFLVRDASKKELLLTAIVRPTKLLTRSPITFLICMYVAAVYGDMYLWFTTIPSFYQETYGWSPRITGLAYIGMGVGMVIALAFMMHTNDATVIRLTKRNNNIYQPEFRLPYAIYFAPFIPTSLFWYGWSTATHTHWSVPIIGSSLFGFGMLGLFLPTQQYLVDAFEIYAASAVAAVRTAISIAGATLPLAGPPLYRKLGLGWGNSVLGFLALAMTPIPWLFMKYGRRIRERWPVTL